MKLRGAVVGVGYLGNFHAQKYRTLCDGVFSGKIQFVGVCDTNFAQAEKVAKENNVKAFSKIEELVGQVDFVTIATVTSSHFEIARFFLEKGIHINVEKPMTVTVEQAYELVRIAKEKGLVLCVGHSERFNPAFRELKTKISKPKYIELSRHAPYKSRGADVSVVHDLMIHDLDLALSLDESSYKVTDVVGGKIISTTYDYAAVTIQFESGLDVRISVSRLAGAMTRMMKVICSEKVFEANLQTGDLIMTSKDSAQGLVTTATNCGKGDNLLLETEAYFYACLGEKTPFITGEQGLRALSVAEEICRRIEQLS